MTVSTKVVYSPEDCKCEVFLVCHTCCGSYAGCRNPAVHMQGEKRDWDYTIQKLCNDHKTVGEFRYIYLLGDRRSNWWKAFRHKVNRQEEMGKGVIKAIVESQEVVMVEQKSERKVGSMDRVIPFGKFRIEDKEKANG